MNQLLDQELTTNIYSTIVSNFAFLESENSELAELGSKAEDYLETDPETSIVIIGQFAEFLARQVAENSGLDIGHNEKQYDLIKKLKDDKLIDSKVYEVFDLIRLKRNNAVHPKNVTMLFITE